MKIKKAVLLAAGKGTRLHPLTESRPKPMLLIGESPVLEYTIRRLVRYGISEIAINLHHSAQVVIDYFGDGSRHGVKIVYSYEPSLLGTAGAIKKLSPLLRNESFYVQYGDNLTTCELERFTLFHEQHGGIASIALFYKEDVTPHSAVELMPDGRITRFVEKPKAEEAPSQWISAGVLLLEPEILDFIPANAVYDFGFHLFPKLLSRGEKIYGYCMSGSEGLWWIDTPLDYKRIGELFTKGSSFL
jgi:NDP-sugar pyrophosphorylase family protein